VELKRDYAFIEFSDPRDADDAQYNLDGREVDGSRIIVEFAKGVPWEEDLHQEQVVVLTVEWMVTGQGTARLVTGRTNATAVVNRAI